MIAGRVERASRVLGAPQGWDHERQGRCGSLAIRDEETSAGWAMISAWEPTPDEIERIAAGAPVHLMIVGRVHPPLAISVGPVPDGRVPPRFETKDSAAGDDVRE